MIRNYFKIAFRSLWKYKTNSFVSIAGLAIGIGCFLLLATYILHEARYDRFQEKGSRIARVNLQYQSGEGAPVHIAITPTAVAPVFSRSFQEIEKAVRLYALSGYGAVPVQYEDKLYNEKKILFADSTFFQIFSFPFVEGDPATALSQPNSVVIDQTTAQKFFGSASAIGKSVKMNEKYTLQITGVIKDVPSYSHIKFNWLGSYSTLPRSKTEAFDSANDYTYLLLRPNASLKTLQGKVDQFTKQNLEDPQNPSVKVKLELEPFERIHLYSKAGNALEAAGDYKYIYVLSGVAILILLIACINFINLVTARSAMRAREVGVRKVMGAVRMQLFRQHLLESAIITLSATFFGVLIALVCLPGLSNLTGNTLDLAVWPGYSFPLALLTMIIVVTLLSGAYPAAVLSKFEPIKVLKGPLISSSGGSALRSFLVVFQFAISMLFIIATIIANQQLYFIQHKNLGMNPDQIIVLDLNSGISTSKLAALKNELLNNSKVKSVSASYDSPVNVQGGYTISADEKPQGSGMNITAIPVEKDFVPTLGMKLVAGENFNDTDIAQATVDSFDLRVYAFILNESAVKAMGWQPTQAIGKSVNMNGRRGKIKAVAQDFHFRSLHEKIGAIAIIPEYNYFGKVMVKVSGADATEAVEVLKKSWKENFPMRPFEYHFLDSEFDEMYKAENKVSTILELFSVITVAISCLGLFALIAFIAQQRTKEIGVRKVLGASVASIVMLLSRDFMKLIFAAIILASPVAWYFMSGWLEDFAYRIQISAWVFVLAAIIAIVITLLTISFQSIKAALADPVRSLRSE
ncbi:ABC transporter permease [Dyadobacter luticola]|uniref:FtsX-like permease family protein n=1 Tax=Dyadobacter luticola TaxID=1979387 RepID=A0A5R9KY55_9BACT|nr:ABC transporter permease [Dyadobacter luticola]TLV01015.1 FtsX-like permease family protein [Dyadobacter luticola]